MVTKTSTTESTSQQVEAKQTQEQTTTATKSNEQEAVKMTVEATAVQADALAVNPYATQLQALEERLNHKIENTGKTGILWVFLLLAIAGASYSSYVAFKNEQYINTIQTKYDAALNRIDVANIAIENKASLLEQANNNVAQLQKSIDTLAQNDQNISNSLNGVLVQQQNNTNTIASLDARLTQFSERNPYDWQLSESYFLVNNAMQKAIFEKDVKAGIWMLTKADELLVGIEQEDILKIRETISKDIATLKNIQLVDLRGLGLELDRAFDNVDQLVLNGYSDPKARAVAFAKNEGPTENIQDWKENLISSAKDFSSRFIEIRRRDVNAATEFLTPAQDVYLRENIKTRILLAKSDLSHGEKEAMQKNLEEAIVLVKAYFDQESQTTKATLELLTKLAQSDITIKTPELLESANIFSQYAKEHLIGR